MMLLETSNQKIKNNSTVRRFIYSHNWNTSGCCSIFYQSTFVRYNFSSVEHAHNIDSFQETKDFVSFFPFPTAQHSSFFPQNSLSSVPTPQTVKQKLWQATSKI
jgi:hypothetical protein